MAQRDQVRRMGKTLGDILAGDAFLDAIVEAESEKVLAQLKANPRAHLQGKGRAIPDEVSVEFTEGPPWGIRLGLTGGEGVRAGFEAQSGQRGPETDPKDRARFRRLERQVHESMDSDAFLGALEEATKDQKAFAEFKANPKAHLQRKGLRIPDEVDVKITEGLSPHCGWHCWTWWRWRFCRWYCC